MPKPLLAKVTAIPIPFADCCTGRPLPFAASTTVTPPDATITIGKGVGAAMAKSRHLFKLLARPLIDVDPDSRGDPLFRVVNRYVDNLLPMPGPSGSRRERYKQQQPSEYQGTRSERD
jgi:hypothetical protein